MNTVSFSEFEAYNGYRLMKSGEYLRGKCHVHGGDNQLSGQFNPKTGHYKCHQCGVYGYDHEYVKGTNGYTVKTYKPQQPEIKPVRSDLAGLMANCQTALPGGPGEEYLKSRGIPLELAQKYGVGYAASGKWIGRKQCREWRYGGIVFPHSDCGGNVINLYFRAVGEYDKIPDQYKPTEAEWKDIKHCHLSGNKGVFNAPALSCGIVFLCEGVFDALSLIAAGHDNTCAIFGNTGLSKIWQWVKAQILIFCFDNDSGGEKWKQLAAEAILNGKKVYFLEKECYQDFKDLNEVWMEKGKIDVGDLPESPDEQKETEEPSSEVAPSSHHEESFSSALPELTGPNTSKGEHDDLLQGLSPTERARREAIITVNHQYQGGTYLWLKEHHPDSVSQSTALWEAMDAAVGADDEPGTRQAGAALAALWQRLKDEYAAVFGAAPADPVRQDGFLPAELAELDADLSEEVTVKMGEWNRRILKREAAKVSKSASGGIICELI